MKKIILLLVISVPTLFSCSTDDTTTFESKAPLTNEKGKDIYQTLRDTTSRFTDTIIGSVNPKPIKP
jgi:hypothetical protein